ncbi:[protein-PII] uridylyltransferase [Ferrovum myxofaciens]|uniref:(Protein-PII) uridylyltransferase / (Protein-PII)-UMP uridylyl-removing enzyme n=1 Tax=mine drainage metagenome TaxID=410659 RepID=A0A3P3ZNP1_9ZZZZ|nr:[protein-PII] uridylyltransferase [Ferrovum myxofaciens]
MHATATLKSQLQKKRAELFEAYLRQPSPRRLLKQWCAVVDETLRQLWSTHDFKQDATLVAVGGYGRGELYPYSDIDLLILLPGQENGFLTQRIESFIGTLWDIGLEVGHSVRTEAECLKEAVQDLTIATNLSEQRFLSGKRRAQQELCQKLPATLDLNAFRAGKIQEQRQRHHKHHDTAFNLEPNLKESPGGLRDLHTISWIAWGAGLNPGWASFTQAGLISAAEARQARTRWGFLQDLRIRLQGLAQRREDRLLFDYQTSLALQLGWQDSAQRRASEGLMQAYYKTAKSVLLMNAILVEQIEARTRPVHLPPVLLQDPFVRQGDLLGTTPGTLLDQKPELLFNAFLLLQQYPDLRGFTPDVLRAVWRGKRHINAAFRSNPVHQQQFLEILRQPARTADVLKRMNYLGVLGRYLPAFGRIVGQMQHDLYHAYTVDEHTLKVIRNLRRFALPRFNHEFPLCSTLMQQFDRPDLLILAALFHDIAKGRGGNHAQLGRSDALYFCRQHHLPRTDTQLVAWLVEQHLNFSAVAQKQDLSDPAVICRFAEQTGNLRRLTALYLLTVADIRGTSPKVWNAWKGKLLEDLYRLTAQVLEGEQITHDEPSTNRQTQALEILKHYGLQEVSEVTLWKTLEDGYFRRHEIRDIAWHARSLQGCTGSSKPRVRARLSPVGEGFQVLIYSPDRTGLFAHLCEYFERSGQAIVAARIHTTLDQHALDTFQVLPHHSSVEHYRTQLKRIENELQEQLDHPGPLPTPRRSRLPRQLRHFPYPARILLGDPERDGQVPLTVVAGDRPGLLYRLACVFLRHDIDLHGARINTLGERVEDVFLISSPRLDNPTERQCLHDDLLHEVSQEQSPMPTESVTSRT